MFVENVTIEFATGMLFALACVVSRRIEPHATRLAAIAWRNEQCSVKGSLDTFRSLLSKGKVAVIMLAIPIGGILMANAAMLDSAPFALQIAGGGIVIVIVVHTAWRGGHRTIGRIRARIQ